MVSTESTVIPDTPQNRIFLEDLHKALEILVDKLMEFAGSSCAQKLLDAIASKQNLLELKA